MLKKFRESFAPLLSDPEFQREFLEALYEEKGAEGIFEGLREIATATKKMPEIAESAGVARTSLYRSLAPGGNPNFKTVRAALNTLGMDFATIARALSGDPLHAPAEEIRELWDQVGAHLRASQAA